MQNIATATRIVEISEDLQAVHLAPEVRTLLSAEQSELWDRDYRGRPYEEVLHDAWLFRRYP